MRTTVTLDPDVERLIRTAMRERGISFKQALNQAARAGLQGGSGSARPKRKFVQEAFHMGAPKNFRWEKILALADAMEDEEIIRKMTLRK
jgi:hypothetical protein